MTPPRKRAPGGGRKPTGKTVVTRSVSMPPAEWDRLDRLRGTDSRGVFIAKILPEK
jgi:hypothetical protein